MKLYRILAQPQPSSHIYFTLDASGCLGNIFLIKANVSFVGGKEGADNSPPKKHRTTAVPDDQHSITCSVWCQTGKSLNQTEKHPMTKTTQAGKHAEMFNNYLSHGKTVVKLDMNSYLCNPRASCSAVVCIL